MGNLPDLGLVWTPGFNPKMGLAGEVIVPADHDRLVVRSILQVPVTRD